MDKPQLSKQAFWDVDMDSIDYEKHARYVMEKVINGGTTDDFISVRNFYGDNRIRKEIIHTKEFGPKEVSFCCLIFKLTQKDFKFPANKPAYPEPWDYSGA